MTDIVPASEIEAIVGTKRHAKQHIARADSETETIYILHSQECKDITPDLRQCGYSIALDRGIRYESWEDVLDRPVYVGIYGGRLDPLMVVTDQR